MSVINITNFGGEIPRMSARALPPIAATVNSNLLATATEFRPVKSPLSVAVVATYDPQGISSKANTLFRFGRNASGSFRTSDGDGWTAYQADINFVRGQLNDDATERTYTSQNDGTFYPQAVDITGVPRRLGVPAPEKPVVTLNASKQFTLENANTWLGATLVPAVKQALLDMLVEDQVKSRYVPATASPLTAAGVSVAGVTSINAIFNMPQGVTGLSPRGIAEPWNMAIGIPLQTLGTTKLNDPQFGGVTATDPRGTGVSYHYLPVTVLPFWGRVTDTNALRVKLAKITNPRDGATLFTDGTGGTVDTMSSFAAGLVNLFEPSKNKELAAKRSTLDAAFNAFSTGISTVVSNSSLTAPVEPNKNNRSAYPAPFYFQPGSSSSGDGSGSSTSDYKTPSYVQYEADYAAFLKAKEKYVADVAQAAKDNVSSISTIADAQKACEAISHEIEAMYFALKDGIEELVKDYLSDRGLVKTTDSVNGIVEIDPDRIVDTRFYVTTFVTDWDEESANSPVSDLLEVDQNDSVTIAKPTPPPGRHINRWRIYRSNVGTNTTAFQFVKELSLTDTVRAPFVPVGATGYFIGETGYNGIFEFQDVIASWLIYTYVQGHYLSGDLPKNNDHLAVGDTVRLTNPKTGFVYLKSWNGHTWGQKIDAPSGVGSQAFVDGKSSSELGEVLPTTSWAEPPTLVNGSTTTYLKGLVGMPNGIMAGFLDNFVAFCDPFHPYAWPVEYQIPLEYPIVGLGVFGQSLFVGTMANPYVISGSDSASMSAQKLNSSQSCVSRRSIVATTGGVFYASPDGYCFCDYTGASCITDGLFANEDWKKLDPSSIFAVIHDNVLYFWYSGNGGGCYGLDLTAKKLTRHDLPATAVFEDVVTDYVYAHSSGQVYKLFAGDRAMGRWVSGNIVIPQPVPFAWLQAWGDQSESYPATFKWYSDGVLLHTAVVTSNAPVRLPAGRYREHTLEISSQARITEVTVAGTTVELKQV